jgi:hypothetical protein
MLLNRPSALPWAAAVGSIFVALHDAAFYWRDAEPASNISTVWPYAFLLLLVMCVDRDSRTQPAISRPSLDFGLLVFLYWIPYLPYYMWRTRGVKGIALVLAFAVFGLLSELLMWGIDVAG